MLNAIRRFKSLVANGIPQFNYEEDGEKGKVKCRISKSRSGHRQQITSFQDGDTPNTEDDGNIEFEVVKPKLWNVDIEYATEADDEDSRTKALRLFRFKILYAACSMDPSPESDLDKSDFRYKPSPDYDTIRACRLVCKDWNEEISAIFLAVEKPLLTIDPVAHLQKRKRQGATHDPESILDVLRYPLVRPEYLQPPMSDLAFPLFKLRLPSCFFYKEVENAFIHAALPHFERYIYELQCYLPADSTMRFFWPTLNLENLHEIKFKCTNDTQARVGGLSSLQHNPFVHGNYMYFIQQVLNGAVNAELFTLQSYSPHFAPGLYKLILPRGLTFMDIPLVRMAPEDYADCLEYCDPHCIHGNDCLSCPRSLKHLIIRSPLKSFRREEEVTSCHASFLLEKYGKSLENLELDVSGQEMDHIIWTMRRDFVYEPLKLEISKPLRKLRSLSLHAGNWELSGMTSYERFLPSLKSLRLTLITSQSQIEDLFRSRSESLEKLKLSFIHDMPYEVMRGFADNLPWLRELEVIVKERYSGLSICFQGFLRLRKLHLVYAGCNSEEGREMLNWAVTGIPVEDFRAMINGDMTVLEAIEQFQDRPSLRNLLELEELKLFVKGNYKMDISIMLRTTFLRMRKLERLILSEKTIMIEDEQKDYIRKENQFGLSFEWV